MLANTLIIPLQAFYIDVQVWDEVDLVQDCDLRIEEDHGVLIDHVIALGWGYDDHPMVRAQGEVRRADQIADVLDEQEIEVLGGQVVQSMIYQVRVQVAFLSCIDVERCNRPPRSRRQRSRPL